MNRIEKNYHFFFLTSIFLVLCIFLFHYDHFIYDLFTDRDFMRSQSLEGYLTGFGPELSWSGHTFGSFLYGYLFLLNVLLHLSPQNIYILNFLFFITSLYWLYSVLRRESMALVAGPTCLLILFNFTVLSELNNLYHPTLALPFLNLCWIFIILSFKNPSKYLWSVIAIVLFLTQLHLSFWLLLVTLTFYLRSDFKLINKYQWGLLLIIAIILLGPAGYRMAQGDSYFDGYVKLIKNSPTIAGLEYLENFNIFNYSKIVRLIGRMAQRFLGIFVFEELRINHYLTVLTFSLWAIIVSTLRINTAKTKLLLQQRQRFLILCLYFLLAAVVIYFLSPKTLTSFRRSSFLQLPFVYLLMYLLFYFTKYHKTLLCTVSLLALTNLATWSFCMDGKPCGTLFHRGLDYAVIKNLSQIKELKQEPHALFKLTELRKVNNQYSFFDGTQRYVGLDYFFFRSNGHNPESQTNPVCWSFLVGKNAPEQIQISHLLLTKVNHIQDVSFYSFRPEHNFCPYSFKNPYHLTQEQKQLATIKMNKCSEQYCFQKDKNSFIYKDRLGRSFMMTFKEKNNEYIVDLVTINMEVYNALVESKFTEIVLKINGKSHSFFPREWNLAKLIKQPFQMNVPMNQTYTIEAFDLKEKVVSEQITL